MKILGVFFLVLFLFSLVSAQQSFCEEFLENDSLYGEYDGRCHLYSEEHLFFSGMSLGIDFINEDSVRIILNGENSNLLGRGNSFSDSLFDYKSVEFFLQGVFYSESVKGVDFYYNFSYKENGESFCYGDICILDLDDRLYLENKKLRLVNLTDVGKGCFDLLILVDGEDIELDDVCVNESFDLAGLDVNFLSLDDDGVVSFSHDFVWNNYSCLDSDGKDFYSKGNVRGLILDENYTYGQKDFELNYFEDYCYSLNPLLVEFYCEKGYIKSEMIKCDKCKDGACVNFTNEELIEKERVENLGKDNFSVVKICTQGCLLNDTCYSYGYSLPDRNCSEDGWDVFEKKVEKVSIFKKIWRWFFGK